MKQRGRPRKFDRNEILKKAMMTFWSQGYDRTSMSDLTESMGLNSPSIYAAFGSKDQLFQEVVELYLATEGQLIWSAVKAESNARSATEKMLNMSAEVFTQPHKPGGCLVTLGAIHSGKKSTEIHQLLSEKRNNATQMLKDILVQGKMSGEISEKSNVEAIADYYIAIQQGMSIKARDGAGKDSLLKIAELAMNTWNTLT
ncbi:TetR/AcrR family transcriptional regulator [Planctobacterium marinum]|uniref:TetR/AcrR family transcriptional regulator n=1 Tax=Planctobacterium marinum TaxID=1631968 RepID=UPI00366E87F4